MKNTLGKSIQKCFPLLAWENNCLISQYADVTVLYQLTLPAVFERGVERFEQDHATWVRAMRLLPDYCLVHKQDIYQQTTHTQPVSQTEQPSFLQQASNAHFEGRKYIKHTCYVYVTLSSKQNLQTKSVATMLCQNRLVPKEMTNKAHISNFLDKVNQFEAVLCEAGYTLCRLDANHVLGTHEQAGLLQQYLSLHFDATPTCLADMHVSEGDFMVGDNYVSAFSLHNLEQLPAQVHTHKLHSAYTHAPLPVSYVSAMGFELPFSHIYNQYFFFDNHNETLAAIEKCGREQQSLSAISRQNAINKTFNDAYLNESISTGRRSVRCAFNVMLWDTDYYALLKKNALVSAALAQTDAFVAKTEGIVPLLFWAGIPGAGAQYPAEMSFLTFLEQGACFINGETSPVDQGKQGIRLCDRLFGVPLNVDLSDENNELYCRVKSIKAITL